MFEVRFHGRGGQGAVMASRILANAFVREGKFGSAFPMFGFERRGAPVTAFGRFDDQPIREKTQIYNPDCLLVLDPAQSNVSSVYDGLKPEGVLVINKPEPFEEKPHQNLTRVGMVDANTIAMEEIKIQAPNTCMLGVFAATTKRIKLESILAGLEDYFEGKKLDGNIRCVHRGFEECRLVTY